MCPDVRGSATWATCPSHSAAPSSEDVTGAGLPRLLCHAKDTHTHLSTALCKSSPWPWKAPESQIVHRLIRLHTQQIACEDLCEPDSKPRTGTTEWTRPAQLCPGRLQSSGQTQWSKYSQNHVISVNTVREERNLLGDASSGSSLGLKGTFPQTVSLHGVTSVVWKGYLTCLLLERKKIWFHRGLLPLGQRSCKPEWDEGNHCKGPSVKGQEIQDGGWRNGGHQGKC